MSGFGHCKGGGRRRTARGKFECIVNYRTLLRSGKAFLADVSSTGARLRGEELPKAGEDLVVNFDGETVFAMTAWSVDDHCGLTFDPPLPPTTLTALARKVRSSDGLSPQHMAAFEDWQGGVAR